MNEICANPVTVALADCGLEVVDLVDNVEFAARPLHARDVNSQIAAMERLGRAFVERPASILQELVNVAVDLCGADSAGISVERDGATDEEFYHWVATAGIYRGFLDAMLPRHPSACGLTLQRGTPQLFRVSPRFFEILHVDAPTVTDGLLLPWEAEGTRGTIFVMAHGRSEAFDKDDCRTMQILANFASTAIRQTKLRELSLRQAEATAAAAMANQLAHQINNPLQSLTNLVYLAGTDVDSAKIRELSGLLSGDLQRLSDLVGKLLALPVNAARREAAGDPENFTGAYGSAS